MEQNTLLHSSQLSIAVINITLYYNDYGPAYTDTVGWLSVATNTMTHRLRTSNWLFSVKLNIIFLVFFGFNNIFFLSVQKVQRYFFPDVHFMVYGTRHKDER